MTNHFNRKRIGLISMSVFLFLLLLPSFSPLSAASSYATNSVSQTPAVITTQPYTGYQVTGNYATLGIRIKGSWIVPTANCAPGQNSVSNISVVIDGINGEGDVMQVGTYQNCVNGVAQYGAFANFAPSVHKTMPSVLVKPGDTVEAQGKWSSGWHAQIIVIDATTHIKTVQRLHASTAAGFTPKLDSGAFLLSSVGTNPLTSFSTSVLCGKANTSYKNTDIVGSPHATNTIQAMAGMTGFTLVSYQMPGTTLSLLDMDGGSFQIT